MPSTNKGELKLRMVRLCDACGYSDASKKLNGKEYCGVCYGELRYGTVINCNVNFFGGRPATLDDISPGQENAIRDMEG